MRKFLVAILVALGAVACGVPASAIGHPGAGFYGVVYPFNSLDNADLPRMGNGHVASVRWTLSWPQIETSKGNYNWSEADRMIGSLASRGIHVLPVLYGSPGFVAPTNSTPPVGTKKARNAWSQFLTKAVQRYGPHGSFWTSPLGYRSRHLAGPVLPIKTWQVWNEPNLKGFFHPKPSPKRYAKLVQISHDAIKGADSHAKIVLAGMPGYGDINAWTFLDRMYKIHGFANDFDIAAIHPYAPNMHLFKSEIQRMRKVLAKHGDAHKKLLPTEVGWGSKHPDRFGLNQGKKGQARLLKKSFQLLTKKRHAWRIGGLYWFEFRDPKKGHGGCSFCDSAGLLSHNGHPKPSWRAYKHFTH